MAPTSLRVLHALDGIAVGEIGNVCIVLWRGPVTPPRFDAQRDGLAQVATRHPEGMAFLCVIEATAKPPDDELRRAAAKMVKDLEASLRGIACVVEGSGFVNAVSRSALSAIALILGSRKYPFAVHGAVGQGTRWLASRAGSVDEARLAAAVESMRGAIEAWPVRLVRPCSIIRPEG